MGNRYLLDTSICLHIAQNRPPALRERFSRHSSRELGISVITLGELRCAAECSAAPEQALAGIAQLEQLISIYPLPETAGEHYGQISASVLKLGPPLGTNDCWLAAHARAEGWVLVTARESDFLRIPGLQLENWITSDA